MKEPAVTIKDLITRNIDIHNHRKSPWEQLMVASSIAYEKYKNEKEKTERLLEEKTLKKPLLPYSSDEDFEEYLRIKRIQEKKVSGINYKKRQNTHQGLIIHDHPPVPDRLSQEKTEKFLAEKALKKPLLAYTRTNRDEDFEDIRTKRSTTPKSIINCRFDGDSDEEDKESGILRICQEKKVSDIKNKKRENTRRQSLHDHPPIQRPRVFQELMRKIKGMGGTDYPVLVIQKSLTKTDMSYSHSRLSMPKKQLACSKFLTYEEEERIILKGAMEVKIVEPDNGSVSEINFNRWEPQKENGKSNVTYVFQTRWNELKERNQLKENQKIQVWSFRVLGKLHFALVKLV